MDAGFGSWLFVMSVGASALGGMLGMASGIFIVPILTLFGSVDLPHGHRRKRRLGDRLLLRQRCILP
jgi:uncharacterized membrane protein YfcA